MTGPRVRSSKKTDTAASTTELVIITGLSGSGKGTVLRALEDVGYYSVDNMPMELLPKFAELTEDSPKIRRAALVMDVREAESLSRFPAMFRRIRRVVPTKLLFLEADDSIVVRRFSETRRPHPLGTNQSLPATVKRERGMLEPIRKIADHVINTSKFTVHDLREWVHQQFAEGPEQTKLIVYINSFGFRNGVPSDSDLVFDVRFLPNPNYVPEFKPHSGKDPKVARYIKSFPQTTEFTDRIGELLVYLLPHYIEEGKSYLTISFGCTGGRHRSVYIAEELARRLKKARFNVKLSHRDIDKH
jgi:UPF0042 nucleotide-binding protein